MSTTIEDDFKARLGGLAARATAAGSSITAVCRDNGIARATYERWMQRPPQTITKLAAIERQIQGIEAEAANKAATAE